MFAVIICALSFFNYESPRYLIKVGQDQRAIEHLAHVRNLAVDHERILAEIGDIQRQISEEREATMGQGWFGVVKEMVLIPSNLYRLYLGVATQLLTQWCGAQSITVYAPDFFGLVGVHGQNEKLLATCVLGVVKLVGALICAFFLVDFIGRKRSLTIGVTIQAISVAYIAIFLSVVSLKDTETFTHSQKSASIGAIAMIYICSFGWALGFNGIQYLLNAEIYPLRIRAISSSIVMMLHFLNQYGANRAVPIMLLPLKEHGMGPAGTWWFFTAITIFSGVWAWFSIPETSQVSLEDMDRLFALPWYLIGRSGGQLRGNVGDADEEKSERVAKEGVEVQVEDVRSARSDLRGKRT